MVALGVALFILLLAGLVTGSVPIAAADAVRALFTGAGTQDVVTIVREVRLPEVFTAILAGSGLAACGLMMQTLFRNPLAGPGVLGITSGASLGVAIVMLARPVWGLWLSPEIAVIAAALTGALAVLALIVLADRRVGDGVTLLIIGIMVGHVCGALISVLQSASWAAALKNYVLWGMGSFAGVAPPRIIWLAVPVLIGLSGALWSIKPLNALLLGDELAASLGVNVHRTRRILIGLTGLLAGTITAFCGPIAFLGLATPHVARAFLRSSDHARLMPATLLTGAVLALACDLIVRNSGPDHTLPLNAITSLLGAPVVLWVLLSGKRWARSN